MTRKLLFMNEKIEPKPLLRNLKAKNSSLADKETNCLFNEQANKFSRLSFSSISQKENDSNGNSRPNSCFLYENKSSLSRHPSSNLNEISIQKIHRIVTSFDELCDESPGSRNPIDIQHSNNQNQSFSNFPNNTHKYKINSNVSTNRETSFGSINNFNNFLSYNEHNPNEIESTINFSKLLINANRNKNEISSKVNLSQLNDEEMSNPVNNSTINRKYFSFLTTNKLFSSSLNINEPKLRVHNNQLIDENDSKQQRMSANPKKEEVINVVAGLSSSPSSSSTSASNSDSGCGCSIARSSILSNLDLLNHNEPHMDLLTVPISSNFEYSSSHSSPSTSPKLESDSSSELNITSVQFNEEKRKKVLTILFDYVSNGFQVKKNDTVKVIRDYDENLYLVAAISNGSIGFIPKEYTVDLDEIKHRVVQNQNAFLGHEKQMQPLSNFSFNSRFKSIENNIKNSFNFKLTKL